MYNYFVSDAREHVRKVAVFVTDGAHNTPYYDDPLVEITNAILPAHQADIVTIAIGKLKIKTNIKCILLHTVYPVIPSQIIHIVRACVSACAWSIIIV